jgi:hypothetical protein
MEKATLQIKATMVDAIEHLVDNRLVDHGKKVGVDVVNLGNNKVQKVRRNHMDFLVEVQHGLKIACRFALDKPTFSVKYVVLTLFSELEYLLATCRSLYVLKLLLPQCRLDKAIQVGGWSLGIYKNRNKQESERQTWLYDFLTSASIGSNIAHTRNTNNISHYWDHLDRNGRLSDRTQESQTAKSKDGQQGVEDILNLGLIEVPDVVVHREVFVVECFL